MFVSWVIWNDGADYLWDSAIRECNRLTELRRRGLVAPHYGRAEGGRMEVRRLRRTAPWLETAAGTQA